MQSRDDDAPGKRAQQAANTVLAGNHKASNRAIGFCSHGGEKHHAEPLLPMFKRKERKKPYKRYAKCYEQSHRTDADEKALVR